MVNVEKDEQRHIAFGVKLLADLNRQDPEVAPAVREILGTVMPYALGVFRPPNDDERYIEVFGETMVGVAVTGSRQLETRVVAAGLEPYGPTGVLPFLDPDTSYEERATRAFVMQRAGFFSGGTEPIKPDQEALDYYFELVAAAVRPDNKLKGPTTILWDFTDAGPRHMRIEGGRAKVAAGPVENADITFRTDLSTWIGISGGFVQPGRALLTRKLKLKGSPITLAKLPGVFQTP
jgi:hypothetical protein